MSSRRRVGALALLACLSGCKESGVIPGDEPGFNPREMIRVPAGAFVRGCESPDVFCQEDPDYDIMFTTPRKEIFLSEFYIDKYEVTWGQWWECANAGVCQCGPYTAGGCEWHPAWEQARPHLELPDFERLPVTYVSWTQADAYCRWRGKRLPTEAEWEKAARGADGRRFPWGDEVPSGCNDVNARYASDNGIICENLRGGSTLPVDWFNLDVSPYGVVGMGGNAQEWVNDFADGDYYSEAPDIDPPGPSKTDDGTSLVSHGLRGGAFDATLDWYHIARRGVAREDNDDKGNASFRCASDTEVR